MDFMTRGVFDTLIILCIIVGLILAARRLYVDFTRPMPGERNPGWQDDDTAENPRLKVQDNLNDQTKE